MEVHVGFADTWPAVPPVEWIESAGHEEELVQVQVRRDHSPTGTTGDQIVVPIGLGLNKRNPIHDDVLNFDVEVGPKRVLQHRTIILLGQDVAGDESGAEAVHEPCFRQPPPALGPVLVLGLAPAGKGQHLVEPHAQGMARRPAEGAQGPEASPHQLVVDLPLDGQHHGLAHLGIAEGRLRYVHGDAAGAARGWIGHKLAPARLDHLPHLAGAHVAVGLVVGLPELVRLPRRLSRRPVGYLEVVHAIQVGELSTLGGPASSNWGSCRTPTRLCCSRSWAGRARSP